MRRGSLMAALAALTAQLVALDVARAEPEWRTYIVQPGDSVWSIAAELYGSGDKYPIIYEHNGFVGRPPFLLQPGQVLKLPVAGTPPAAQLEWLVRDVKAKPPRALDWLDARARMNLWRLYRVSTGDASAAHIIFDDTSDLRLRENALLVIYGASASATRTARRDKTEVVLEQGTIQGGLEALDAAHKPAPMIVKTPSGVVDILAGLTQVQAEVAISMVSVYEGQAAVSAQGARVEVPGGQGTVVEKGKRPEAPRPLPLAPVWSDAGGPALVPTITRAPGTPAVGARWQARWQPVPGANTYRVELASDEGFDRVVYDAEVGAGVQGLELVDLEPGRYFVRVSTRDARGLESRPGPARALEVVPLRASRALSLGPDGVPEVVGFVRLDPAEGAPEGLRVRRAEGAAGADSRLEGASILLGEPGTHRLIFEQSGASGELVVRVLGVHAVFTTTPGLVPRQGEPRAQHGLALDLRVEDERGRPALLPGLLVGGPAGPLTPTPVGPGVYRLTVPALATDAPEAYPVAARWAGGELGEVRLSASPPAPRPAPSRVALPLTPHRLARDLPGPHVAVTPETRLALETALVDLAPGSGSLGLALRGELALDRWGLEAGFAFQDLRLGDVDGPRSRLGNANLGVRVSVLDGDFQLAPFLRLGLPLSAGHGDRLATIEPGVLARVGAMGPVFLDLRLSALHADDLADARATRLGGLAALGWRTTHTLTLAASFESVLGLDAPLAAHLAGLGANLEVGDLRLGLALGLGLGADAEATLGAWSGRLVLDLGLLLDGDGR